MIPTFSFYKTDLEANGAVSPLAVARECHCFQPAITPKLITELKYLYPSKEPITVSVGSKELFKVQFLDTDLRT